MLSAYCCAAAGLLGGCGGGRRAEPASAESGSFEGQGALRLRRLPQDLLVYARQAIRTSPHVGCGAGGRTPGSTACSLARGAVRSVSAAEAFAIFGGQKNEQGAGWRKTCRTLGIGKLTANAARDAYPSRFDKAITVRPTVLREAPTHKPRFGNPAEAGEGYPFDMFMYSTLPVGMPLLVVHTSADGAWVFVETGLVSGWVPTEDTAVTDAPFRSRYENGTYAVIVRDDVPLVDELGRYVTTGSLGTMLPLSGGSGSSLWLLVPVRDPQGRAVAVPVRVSPSDVVRKPIPLTARAAAEIGNRMMGQPYGWGGYLFNRDCSLAMRDLFVPFGVWLPRNSSAQAKAWQFISFVKASPSGKESIIKDEGVPFATLLWLRGHITLYIGEYKGEPVMFHNVWGVRTDDGNGEGRHIIGRAVVTSLQPGAELPNVRRENLILSRLKGMSVLRYD
ncbi:MAG: SH3 domain-containing protein [Bilophila wadsworthia]